MTDEQTQRERERFEAWAKSVCMIDEDFWAAWQGWLARAEQEANHGS